MQRDDQWRLRRQVSGSVGEHTKAARICTKPGQFSQPCRAGWRYAGASRLLSCRCKKTFEFASKRLETGKNLAWIAHQEQPILHRTIHIVRCTIASLGDGAKTFSESNPDAPRHPSASPPGGVGNVRFGSRPKRTQTEDIESALPPKPDKFMTTI